MRKAENKNIIDIYDNPQEEIKMLIKNEVRSKLTDVEYLQYDITFYELKAERLLQITRKIARKIKETNLTSDQLFELFNSLPVNYTDNLMTIYEMEFDGNDAIVAELFNRQVEKYSLQFKRDVDSGVVDQRMQFNKIKKKDRLIDKGELITILFGLGLPMESHYKPYTGKDKYVVKAKEMLDMFNNYKCDSAHYTAYRKIIVKRIIQLLKELEDIEKDNSLDEHQV